MVNHVILVGRLTRDPEIQESAKGKFASLRLVTAGDGPDPQYHGVVLFDRLGEIAAEYLRKGRLVYVEGKLRTREWEGRDGLRRYTTEVVASEMKMLSSVEQPEEVEA